MMIKNNENQNGKEKTLKSRSLSLHQSAKKKL